MVEAPKYVSYIDQYYMYVHNHVDAYKLVLVSTVTVLFMMYAGYIMAWGSQGITHFY